MNTGFPSGILHRWKLKTLHTQAIQQTKQAN